jgi:hypothetical protein
MQLQLLFALTIFQLKDANSAAPSRGDHKVMSLKLAFHGIEQ